MYTNQNVPDQLCALCGGGLCALCVTPDSLFANFTDLTLPKPLISRFFPAFPVNQFFFAATLATKFVSIRVHSWFFLWRPKLRTSNLGLSTSFPGPSFRRFCTFFT